MGVVAGNRAVGVAAITVITFVTLVAVITAVTLAITVVVLILRVLRGIAGVLSLVAAAAAAETMMQRCCIQSKSICTTGAESRTIEAQGLTSGQAVSSSHSGCWDVLSCKSGSADCVSNNRVCQKRSSTGAVLHTPVILIVLVSLGAVVHWSIVGDLWLLLIVVIAVLVLAYSITSAAAAAAVSTNSTLVRSWELLAPSHSGCRTCLCLQCVHQHRSTSQQEARGLGKCNHNVSQTFPTSCLGFIRPPYVLYIAAGKRPSSVTLAGSKEGTLLLPGALNHSMSCVEHIPT